MIEANRVVKHYKVKQQSKSWLSSLFFAEYKTISAVQDVSFHIRKGEIVGLIGLNGAGKTTMIKMLAGLIHPSGGEIRVDGFIPKELKADYLKKIGLVMGNKSQLWWDISAYASFELEGAIYGINESEVKQRVDGLAKTLGVTDLLRTPVRKLSLGERMKMELILALLHNPSILFLDEPTIGLDIISQKKLREFIKKYNEEHMATMVITSHNMRDVEELCDRVIVLEQGNVIYDGKIAELDSYIQRNDMGKVENFEETIARLLEGGRGYEDI